LIAAQRCGAMLTAGAGRPTISADDIGNLPNSE
jgi:hypothetical protein